MIFLESEERERMGRIIEAGGEIEILIISG